MTINQFLTKLRKTVTKNETAWRITSSGLLRTVRGNMCPLWYLATMYDKSLPIPLRDKIIFAADNDIRYQPLRKRLLKAVGLKG